MDLYPGKIKPERNLYQVVLGEKQEHVIKKNPVANIVTCFHALG